MSIEGKDLLYGYKNKITHEQLEKIVQFEKQNPPPTFEEAVIKNIIKNGYCIVKYPYSEDRIFFNTKNGLISDTVSGMTINEDGELFYKP